MKFLFSIGLLLTLLGISGGSWHLLSTTSIVIVPAGRYLVIPGIILSLLGLFWALANHGIKGGWRVLCESVANPGVWCGGILVLFLSDWLDRPYGFFPVQWFRGEVILCSALFCLLLSQRSRTWLTTAAVGAAVMLLWCFFTASNGRLLFSDDHAMFLFRLQLLKENFPFIPFWTPLWNGGIDARDFFATGALAPFLLSAPLVYLFDVTHSYNWIVAYLLWILTPVSSYCAALLFGGTRVTGAVAAIFSVSSSLFWYRWTLKYGTMGFTVSTALAPLVLALGWRFITRSKISLFESIGGVLALSVLLLWTPAGVAIVPPLVLLALPRTKQILRDRRKILTLVAIVAINLPIVFTLWRVSAVHSFLGSHKTSQQPALVSVETPPAALDSATNNSTNGSAAHQQGKVFRHRASGLQLSKSVKGWQEFAISLNPLLLICALPALFGLPKQQRLFCFYATGWLTFLGTIAVPLIPQLELDRMLVILGIVLGYPVARFFTMILSEGEEGHISLSARAIQVILGGFLLASPLAAASVIMNRTTEQYSFASPHVHEVAEMIKRESDGGRALFTGCVLHQLSGGHLAPLALWSSTQLAASSYAHNIWRYEQLVPASFLRRDENGIEEYFDYMSAKILFAHEPFWRTYFSTRPKKYKEIWKGESFTAYKRVLYTPKYSIEDGVTLLNVTSKSITFSTSSSSAVLTFKYYPFLRSSACTLSPFQVAEDLELLKVENCPLNTPITIQSSPPLERILGIVRK
jgi:hypothetical protein